MANPTELYSCNDEAIAALREQTEELGASYADEAEDLAASYATDLDTVEEQHLDDLEATDEYEDLGRGLGLWLPTAQNRCPTVAAAPSIT